MPRRSCGGERSGSGSTAPDDASGVDASGLVVAAAPDAGGDAHPALEGASEVRGVRVAELARDAIHGVAGAREELDRAIAPELVEHDLERGAARAELTLQRTRGDAAEI